MRLEELLANDVRSGLYNPEFHEEFGRLSGIPKCCRDWFYRVRYQLPLHLVYFSSMDKTMLGGIQHVPNVVRYVRCPGCRQCDARIITHKGTIEFLRKRFDVVTHQETPEWCAEAEIPC